MLWNVIIAVLFIYLRHHGDDRSSHSRRSRSPSFRSPRGGRPRGGRLVFKMIGGS